MSFDRSNEEAILATVTGNLAAQNVKVKCELGADEDARRGAPPRITWVPRKGGRKYTHPAQQLGDTKVAHEKNVAYDVHVWGASVEMASRLEESLVAALFNELSPNAYELGEGGPAELPEGPNEGTGYELIIPIRLLRIPIAAERRQLVTLLGATATGQVVGAHGETPASATPDLEKVY